MIYKWIGAGFVIAACSGFGFSLASLHRKQEKLLRQFLQVLEDMECMLQYKLMPLPELCRSSVRRIGGPIRTVLLQFAQELEQQVAPDAPSCMSVALASCQFPEGSLKYLAGQLQGLESVKANCELVLKNLECNREVRIRSYQTLGICTGVAMAILFI